MKSNQSISQEISPEYSLEKTLMLGKREDRRRRGTEKPGVLQSMGSQRVGHDLVTDRQQLDHLRFL